MPSSNQSDATSSAFLPQTFTTPISIKLSDTNYLTWKHQVSATLRGHKLTHFLDGNSSSPPQFLSSADASLQKIN